MTDEFKQYNLPEPDPDVVDEELIQQYGVTGNAKTSDQSDTTTSLKATSRTFIVTNQGAVTFGDGSDGDATISSNTTLTADKYYGNLTIDAGFTLNPGGYRIFVLDTLTINGTIARNGNDGADGANNGAGGGAGGSALADGYLKGSVAGGAGATANGDSGTNGTATSNSIGSDGADGGAGGNAGSNGGSGGTATASNVKLIANWHLATLLDISSSGSTVKFDNSAGAGGGGAGNGANSDGSGGGGASGGGIVAIYARKIVVNSGGAIRANGGDGGAGGNATIGASAEGGGGGAGGNGGQVILVYNELTNNGTIEASGGSGGAGGTGNSGNGDAGNNGNAGNIRQFEVTI